jgi:hypothetical protein
MLRAQPERASPRCIGGGEATAVAIELVITLQIVRRLLPVRRLF